MSRGYDRQVIPLFFLVLITTVVAAATALPLSRELPGQLAERDAAMQHPRTRSPSSAAMLRARTGNFRQQAARRSAGTLLR